MPLIENCTGPQKGHNKYTKNQKSPPYDGHPPFPNDSYGSPLKTTLVRTSTLDPVYLNKNMHRILAPVKLIFKDNVKSMIQNWTPAETASHRRLVKFNFERVSKAEYLVEFKEIDKKDYDHTSPIISCIWWKEKDIFIVTSVDIIVILEYFVRQSFSIEEKNRIRRNLQSLKPLTVARSCDDHKPFFSLLMGMEDPRPRNIEQDLKVFKWENLIKAIDKVIGKYSVVDEYAPLEAAKKPDIQQYALATSIDNTCGQVRPSPRKANSVFMPYERLKNLKRKLNQERSRKTDVKDEDEDDDDVENGNAMEIIDATDDTDEKDEKSDEKSDNTVENGSASLSPSSYYSENNGSAGSLAASGNSQGASIFSNNYGLDSQNLSGSSSVSLQAAMDPAPKTGNGTKPKYETEPPKLDQNSTHFNPDQNPSSLKLNQNGAPKQNQQYSLPPKIQASTTNYYQYPDTSVLYKSGPVAAHRSPKNSGNALSISNVHKLDIENDKKDLNPKKVTLPSIEESLSMHSRNTDNRLAPLIYGPNRFGQSVNDTIEQKKNSKLLPGTKQIHRYLMDSKHSQSLSSRAHTPYQKYSNDL